MYIIAGLGNPGRKYENTRHNMGFMALDLLADACDIRVDKLKFKSLTGEGRLGGQRVLLMKPQTYMNLSGEAVREAVRFYKVESPNLIVLYDDIDLPVGTCRIRKKGSAGTHNGMRSVIYQLADDQFPRIRVGIAPLDRPAPRGDALIGYVIGQVSEAEGKLLRPALETAAKAAAAIVESGVERAMNLYNVRPAPATGPSAGTPADAGGEERNGRS